MDPLRKQLGAALAPLVGDTPEVVTATLTLPPDPAMGDLALPVFRWAKAAGKKPPELAAALVEPARALAPVESAEAKGPYLNLRLRMGPAGALVLDPILAAPETVAAQPPKGKRIVIDYSSPNVAKPFHIGHLNGTVLGNALGRILIHLGYEVVRVNHLGDWGTQFGKSAVAYRRWGSPAELDAAAARGEGAKYLVALYVRFHDEADKVRAERGLAKGAEIELEAEAREWFKRLEAGSAEHRALWQRFVEISIDEFKRVYAKLGCAFEHFTGESFYSDRIPAAVAELEGRGLLVDSEGAQVVMLGPDTKKTPPFLVRKKDGATLYGTRDLAAALYRLGTFDPERILYVVGDPQRLHFQQLFAVVEMVRPGAKAKLVHVSYGHTRFKGRAIKTRSGDVIYLEDVLSEAQKIVREKLAANVEEKGEYLTEDPEALAWRLACSAIVFGYLKTDRAKEIVFDWETAFEFAGDTGPGVQYSHAQLRSILKKAGGPAQAPRWELLSEPEERQLLLYANRFHAVVEEAGTELKPNLIAQTLLDLRALVNSYLRRKDLPKIKDLEEPLRSTRLSLVRATAEVLATGLRLLGLEPAHQM